VSLQKLPIGIQTFKEVKKSFNNVIIDFILNQKIEKIDIQNNRLGKTE